METTRRTILLVTAAIALTISLAHAQTVNIWPGVAPGSENWKQKEKTLENSPLGTVVMNVVTPTLTVYRPETTLANGTSVIIAPSAGRCGSP